MTTTWFCKVYINKVKEASVKSYRFNSVVKSIPSNRIEFDTSEFIVKLFNVLPSSWVKSIIIFEFPVIVSI